MKLKLTVMKKVNNKNTLKEQNLKSLHKTIAHAGDSVTFQFQKDGSIESSSTILTSVSLLLYKLEEWNEWGGEFAENGPVFSFKFGENVRSC